MGVLGEGVYFINLCRLVGHLRPFVHESPLKNLPLLTRYGLSRLFWGNRSDAGDPDHLKVLPIKRPTRKYEIGKGFHIWKRHPIPILQFDRPCSMYSTYLYIFQYLVGGLIGGLIDSLKTWCYLLACRLNMRIDIELECGVAYWDITAL